MTDYNRPTKDLKISTRREVVEDNCSSVASRNGGSTAECDLSEEAMLVNENNAIERILKEANADLQVQ
jgi:hypothetical protein